MKFCIIFIICISFFGLNAQTLTTNLIKNPDLEGHGGCPSSPDEITRAFNWDPGNQDPAFLFPEYFNRCGINGFDIPDTLQPASGDTIPYARAADSIIYPWSSFNPYDGHAGIVTFSGDFPNARTHLSGDFLNAPGRVIQGGNQYFWSMRIAMHPLSGWATGISILLSQDDVNYDTNPAQTNNLSNALFNQPILDTNWVTVSGTFFAFADYDGFSIGNHLDDDITALVNLERCQDTIIDPYGDPMPVPPCTLPFAYYYIDNVCISITNGVCDNMTTVNRDEDLITPIQDVYRRMDGTEVNLPLPKGFYIRNGREKIVVR